MSEENIAQSSQGEPYLQSEESMDPSLQYSERAKRSAKPTWKVTENLEGAKHELSSAVSNLWQRLLSHISTISQPAHNVSPLEGALEQLCTAYEHYSLKSQEYVGILKKLNTKDSLEEFESFQKLNLERDSLVCKIKSNTEARIAQLQETSSRISKSTSRSKLSSKSRSSKYSTLSEQLIRARAEAEATKIQAVFAQKKAGMEADAARQKADMEADAARQKADMEADAARQKAEIETLNKQCEHATAMARLKVLEEAARGSERDSISVCEVEVEDPLKRTRDYVLSQNSEPVIAANDPDSANISPEQRGTDSSAAFCIQGSAISGIL
ncbi:uncharacterized protein LOC142759138 isoform X1 [Rhinoderma darwinii]|uniref:uncharacterized protein LOC142759138 isoform X1 n=1 Tax=Rhinoderma darwinii TaxID=43563 RepID=UPI003F67B48C